MKPRILNDIEVRTVHKLVHKDMCSPLDDGKSRVHEDFKNVFSEDVSGSILVRYCNRDGGFTICIIQDVVDELMWVGASRKSKNDKPNRVRGEMMAFMRAIRHSPVEI